VYSFVKRLEPAAEVRGAADTLWKIESTLEKLGVGFPFRYIALRGLVSPGT
jgi:hypothetical protein